MSLCFELLFDCVLVFACLLGAPPLLRNFSFRKSLVQSPAHICNRLGYAAALRGKLKSILLREGHPQGFQLVYGRIVHQGARSRNLPQRPLRRTHPGRPRRPNQSPYDSDCHRFTRAQTRSAPHRVTDPAQNGRCPTQQPLTLKRVGQRLHTPVCH